MPQFEVFDGFASLHKGMNGGVISTQIPEQQYARGVNVTCRNGVIATRPPFTEITLETTGTSIPQGHFQGMFYYKYKATAYIVFAFNGAVYSYDPIAQIQTELTVTAGRFNQYVDRLHFLQVEEFLVVQDGINLALIVEDTTGRKAIPADNEVPTGTVMAYVHGRIFIKTADRAFIAGDIYKPNDPTAVLKFIETQYLAGGGAFFTPSDKGSIVSMTWIQAYDDATGQGDLLVLCERGIASYHVSVRRLMWQDQPIMKLEPSGKGCASEFASVQINEDLLFMGWKGIQDFALISVESARAHRITDMDREVAPFLDLETQWLLPFTSAAVFDNRLLYTAVGELATSYDTNGDQINDHRFKGLISLDFAPMDGIATMGKVLQPAYDGIWTGVHPIGIMSGLFDNDDHCYVFGKDNDGINHLYELHKEQGDDNGDTQIECRLYTRGMPFIAYDKDFPRPVPFMEKKLLESHIFLSSFRDDVSVTIAASPDFGVHFYDLSTINFSAPMVDEETPFAGGNRQSRAKAAFPKFGEDACQTITGKTAVNAFEFQFLLRWAGQAKISRLMISADANREVKRLECATTAKVLSGVPPDDFTYDLES